MVIAFGRKDYLLVLRLLGMMRRGALLALPPELALLFEFEELLLLLSPGIGGGVERLLMFVLRLLLLLVFGMVRRLLLLTLRLMVLPRTLPPFNGVLMILSSKVNQAV